MFGIIYIMIVAGIAITSCFEYERLRRNARDDAMKSGHIDYVDYKGQQWFGDRKATYTYKDGKEYLVDAKNKDVIYIDITKEKEARAKENQPDCLKELQTLKNESRLQCIGFCLVDGKSVEIETERYAEAFNENGNLYKQYYEKESWKSGNNGKHWVKVETVKIQKDEYEFLTRCKLGYQNKNRANLTREGFLNRKAYVENHGLDLKWWGTHKNGYEIHYESTTQSNQILWVCGDSKDDAIDNFLNLSYIKRKSDVVVSNAILID